MTDFDEDRVFAYGEAHCCFPPTPAEWMSARQVFTGLSKLYGGGNRSLPERFYVLERELERAYCSRCYVACILISSAIVEAPTSPRF